MSDQPKPTIKEGDKVSVNFNATKDQSGKAGTVIASEQGHWYDKQGVAVYEVHRVKGGGMRPTTLADARKLGLVPSVTTILACAAKPGLEAWKAKQILEAALTLPRLPDETLDDYATRIIEDSKAQGRKAAERGTELHAAIEDYIWGRTTPAWDKHSEKVIETLHQYGIDLYAGKPEHSFASSLGYGGKIDWHNDEIVCDFKTKANLEPKRLAYDEHCWQLSAYATGLTEQRSYQFLNRPPITRCANVFVGIDDCQVRIHEWEEPDITKGWRAFQALLSFWQITKNYTP